jgi:hypothetical protein
LHPYPCWADVLSGSVCVEPRLPAWQQYLAADRPVACRGWRVVATFKDDGYPAFKEITRDDFVKLIDAIERGRSI